MNTPEGLRRGRTRSRGRDSPGELQTRGCTRISEAVAMLKQIRALTFSLGLLATVPNAFATDVAEPTPTPKSLSENVGQASSLPVHGASSPRVSGGRMPPELADRMSAPLFQTGSKAATSPAVSTPPAELVQAQGRWWAYQPLHAEQPPAVRRTAWAQTEIDRFILAELEARDLAPAAPAERRILIRRATFDLTGFPPTPGEVDAFLRDDSSGAFARVVDRLLASPAYGERWARHWLDVVRYADYHDADPKARTASCEPLEAWRYRDWVVESFNRDLPFDQFIVHQIAGDLLPNPTGEALYPEGLIATTFLANGAWDRGDADKEKMVSDMVDDQIDTVGKAFLGLTLGCARCHDHKFDPISNEDYYALAGIFYSTHFMDNLGAKGGEITLKRVPLVPRAVAALRDGQVLQLETIKAKLAALDKLSPPVATNHPQRLSLIQERDGLQRELPPQYPVAMTVQEGGMPGGLFPNIQDVPIHIRGSYTRLGPVIPRRLPAFFAGASQPPITQGSGRREVARWIAAKENPLTARVIVNRVWQWHFGEGLVRTPNNFGRLSEPPTHPALLDWLASRFIEDGWSLKKLHRRMLLTATYQQASAIPRAQFAHDPDNRWLGRFAARRLEAEAIRDAMIFVSGRLDPSLGGPAGAEVGGVRRSLYVQTARWDRSNFAMLFDAANPDASVERRTISTVAPQALLMLNHDFAQVQAAHLAKRLLREAPGDDTSRIHWAYQVLFARPARADELEIGLQLLTMNPPLHPSQEGNLQPAVQTKLPSSEGLGVGSSSVRTSFENGRLSSPEDVETAWRDFAHVLLCTNEFIYVD